MHTLIDTLTTNDTLFTLAVTLASAAWTLVKSTAWYQARKTARTNQAVDLLEAAVEETYRVYVQALKAGRADGKLTDEERRRARLLARERGVQMARRHGLDMIRLLGEDRVNVWIAKLVKQLKTA